MRVPFCILFLVAILPVVMAAAEDGDIHSDVPPQETPQPDGTSSIDELFTGNSAADIQAPVNEKVDLSPLLANPIPRFTGSITVKGAVSAGWKSIEALSDPLKNFDGSLGYDLSSGLSLDYRPDPSIHWYGGVSSLIHAGSYSWSAISVDSMYIDYTLLDTAFFTLGKFGIGWGVGRLFTVNDLMADAASGLAIKMVLPVSIFNWTMVLLAQERFFQNKAVPSYQEFGYASQIETSLGPVNLGIAGRYQKHSLPRADLYVKTVLGGVDVFTEARLLVPVELDPAAKLDTPISDPVFSVLGGFFWEGLEPKLKLQAEYMFNSTDPSGRDHNLAVGTSLAAIPGTAIKVSAKWSHAFIDNSGQVVLGFEGDPFPHIHATIGFPIGYGGADSRWVKSTIADYGNVIGGALKIELSISF